MPGDTRDAVTSPWGTYPMITPLCNLSDMHGTFRGPPHRLTDTLFSGPCILRYLRYPACRTTSHRHSTPLDLLEKIAGLCSRLAWASSSKCCGRQRCGGLTVSAVATVDQVRDAFLRAFAGSDRWRQGNAPATDIATKGREPTRRGALGNAHCASKYRAADAMES